MIIDIRIAKKFRIGRVVLRMGSTSYGYPSIRVLDFPLWLVESEGSVPGSDSLVEVLTEIGIKDAKFWSWVLLYLQAVHI